MENIKQIFGSVELKKYLKIFMFKRKLGLKHSGFSNPLLIIGESGIGKSQIVESFAKDEKMLFVKFDLSNVDSVTFNGLMITIKNENQLTHHHTIPSFIHKLKEESINGKKALIFLDEINRSSFETRNAVFKLVINNEWGVDSQKLSPNIFVVGAMNPNTDEYEDTEEIDVAFKKRFIQIEYIPEVEDWLDYAKKSKIHPTIIKILQTNKMLFVYNDPENKKGLDPRTWEDLSYAIYAAEKLYPNSSETIYEILQMYAPYFYEKLGYFFDKNRKELLSISDIDKIAKTKTFEQTMELVSSEYKKLSSPRKIELLKDATDGLLHDMISSRAVAVVLKLTQVEHLLSVYNPLLSNLQNSQKARDIVDKTENIDSLYKLNLFDNIFVD
jgi:hypothetical protein